VSGLPAGLAGDPFAAQVTGSGQVRAHQPRGRVIVVVSGAAGATLASRLDDADEIRTQHLLARATGSYRRGNERR
jgi:hypothetical protein